METAFYLPLKPGDYFDMGATWLTIVSKQNHDPVSLIRKGWTGEARGWRLPVSGSVNHAHVKGLSLST